MPLLSYRARRRRNRMFLVALVAVVAVEVGAQVLAPALEPVPIDWPNAMTQLKHEQLELLEGSEVDGTNIPVTFVGDSAAQQAFLPATFAAIDNEGRLSYNAAIPGGVPGVTRPWLLEQVIPRLEPGVVVWGIGLSDLARGYGEAETSAYMSSLGGKDGILAGVERAAAEVSALVDLRPALRDPSLLAGARRDRLLQDVEESESLLGPGGQRLGYQPGPTDLDRVDADRLFGDYEIDPLDVADIADTIGRLQRRGKDVVLVELPTSPQVVELLPNGQRDVSAFRDALADVAEATSTFVFRAIGPFDESDFVDFVHVSEETAEAITGQVAAALPTLNLTQGGSVFSAGTNIDRVIGQVDNADLRAELELLQQSLDDMDLSCNDPARWMDRTLDVIATMEQVTAAIEQADSDDDERFRRSALARQLSSSVAGRVLLQSGCESGSGGGRAPATVDFLARTSALVATYEHLDAALAPADEIPASPLWMHPDQVFHLEGLRDDAEAGERPEVLFFGSTEARSGIDPTLFTELTGRSAANLGMERATPEVASLWIDETNDVVRPDTLVWLMSPSDLIATCGLEVRRPIYTASANVRAELFEALSWAPAASPVDMILGPAGQEVYAAGLTYNDAFSAFEPGSRGTLLGNTGIDTAFLEDQLQSYGERVQAGLDCDERFDFLVEEVRRLADDGLRVVIVGAPAHPDLLAGHPAGPEGVLASFSRRTDDLVSAGADYIDLTESLSAEQFHRAVAFNDEGRQILTESIAARLG